MKIVKRILLGILGVIVLILFIALFTQKDYTIQREVTINKPKQLVFDYTKMFANQKDINAWLKMDPATKTDVRGKDGQTGAMYTWESETIGKGEQTIKSITESQSIDYDLHFIEPMEGHASNRMDFESVNENQTRVKSQFKGHTPYPFNVILWFVSMEKVIGDNMASTLSAIKTNTEK